MFTDGHAGVNVTDTVCSPQDLCAAPEGAWNPPGTATNTTTTDSKMAWIVEGRAGAYINF